LATARHWRTMARITRSKCFFLPMAADLQRSFPSDLCSAMVGALNCDLMFNLLNSRDQRPVEWIKRKLILISWWGCKPWTEHVENHEIWPNCQKAHALQSAHEGWR
jgi:hypothetical protein